MFGHNFERKITRAQYDRAVRNRGYLTKDDEQVVLTDAERLGYGATSGRVYEENGQFYVSCHKYNSCD